jgi:glycosyltransferase involved in cell wall biosynthesis
MKYFYISSKTGGSGICKYSADFYELVLKEKGYIFIDSSENLSNIFTKVSSRDQVHIEIGIFQKKEIEILFLMLKANYKNVSITLHDAPLLKYPLREFKNKFFNTLSKFYDQFISDFKNATPYIKKIKAIYVLSKKGLTATKKIYKTDNVFYLPHIINRKEIEKAAPLNKNFLYFGFIGKNKGIEYSLKLHEAIIDTHPDVQFYIIGTAIGNQIKYYNYLKETFIKNVHFLGYVQEQELLEVYKKASFAMILFKEYNFFYPVSGSILYSLKKGKIILTNQVNAITEIIADRKNGIYLTGNIKKDTALLEELYNDAPLQQHILQQAYTYLTQNHTSEKVASYLLN